MNCCGNSSGNHSEEHQKNGANRILGVLHVLVMLGVLGYLIVSAVFK